MPDLPLQMPTVPEGFCNNLTGADWVQQLFNLIAQGVAKFEGNDFTVIINSETAPGPESRTSLWRKPSTGLVYQWIGGAWVTPNLEPAGSSSRRLFVGTLTELLTYDGGTVGTVGTNSGPMWEEDTTFQGRSPMGPGLIPGSDPAKTLAIAEAYGTGSQSFSGTSFGDHVHVFGRMRENFVQDDFNFSIGDETNGGLPSTHVFGVGEGDPNPSVTLAASGAVGPWLNTGPATVPGSSTSPDISIVPPVVGTYVIKRTGRTNYVG